MEFPIKHIPVRAIARHVFAFGKKHLPEVLFASGIVLNVASTITAVKATPVALQAIEQAEVDNGGDAIDRADKVKVAAPHYIKPVILGISGIACLIVSHSMGIQRDTALAAAYGLAESTFHNYRGSVEEALKNDPDKLEAINELKASKAYAARSAVEDGVLDMLDPGNRCFDALSGRYFKADREELRAIANTLNRRMRDSEPITVNDWFDEIGLPHTKIGNLLEWTIDKGYIDLSISTQMGFDNLPCLVVDHITIPQPVSW